MTIDESVYCTKGFTKLCMYVEEVKCKLLYVLTLIAVSYLSISFPFFLRGVESYKRVGAYGWIPYQINRIAVESRC